MKQIITSVLYLFTIFAVSHFIFEPTDLYYDLKWLDIPMHIMGGFGVASLVSSIYAYFDRKVSFRQLFIFYTIVAVAWELYEYIHDLVSYREWNGWLDTMKDLVDGFIGTVIAYLFIRK